ncbi:hypothetical protein ASPCADRAFT_133989 [Aspergillus carbonarius ITEM 5010]|uniref:NAD(P)-binding domain-containing protein n=1 Tax=Aspergillus carbonarius (strain ITEM 5010) TaxID=602072 RepID=A0A1R3RBV1_ASPC5|nr:hypothetical protein ASPCADRAFT_133989 [Aspergillus carbonarius ITEM 5010]
MTPKPTLAFFGATGGSVLACLISSLKADYKCNALVRTPTKLLTLLSTHNIPPSLIQSNLTIIPGPATSLPAVTQTLLLPDTTIPTSVDLIITGIGGSLIFNFPNPFPTLDNPTVCADTMRTILAAARTLPSKPKLVVITGTGIHYTTRDVPVLMVPVYHWLLGVPHADKRVMEGRYINPIYPVHVLVVVTTPISTSQIPANHTSPDCSPPTMHGRLQFKVGKDPEFVSALALRFDHRRIPYVLVGQASRTLFGDFRKIRNFEFLIEDNFLDNAIDIIRTAGFPQGPISEDGVCFDEEDAPIPCPPVNGPGAFFHVLISGPNERGIYGTHRHISLYKRSMFLPTLPLMYTSLPTTDDPHFLLANDSRLPLIHSRHSPACIAFQYIATRCICSDPFPMYRGGRYSRSLHPVKILKPAWWRLRELV